MPCLKCFFKKAISENTITGLNRERLSNITCGYPSVYDGNINILELF